MRDELEKIWKEVAVVYFRYYPDICLTGLRKSARNVNTAGILAKN
jgi:hypothetical protein